MSADKHEKTEDPTGKKLDEAKKQGNVAKSQDLVAWFTILLGVFILKMTAVKTVTYMQNVTVQMTEVMKTPDQGAVLKFFIDTLAGSVPIIAPLALAFMVIGTIGHVSQVKFNLATKALKPSFKKLNPITGFKRIFSKKSLFEAGKQLFKTAVIGYMAYRTLYETIISLTVGGPYATGEVIRVTGEAVMDFLIQAALAGLVIGIADYFYQRKSTKDGLKMTKQQVKEEHKSEDGSPEIKMKIKQRQREMSRNRMMAALQDADVVVVNPVHIAIGLKYDAQKGAPRVIAKGAGFVAEKIKAKAEEHNVPLVQDILLARTLHRVCDIDDEIPGEMFEAVAQVLAFVFLLKNRGLASGFHKMPGSVDMERADVIEAQQKQEREEAARKLAEQRFGVSTDDPVAAR